MYTRTYPPATGQKNVPSNYSGTAIAAEGEEGFFADMTAPVCCETEDAIPNGQCNADTQTDCEEAEKEHTKVPFFESFATGDLLLLAVAALLAQSESPDNELLIILLFLLLGN